MLGHLHLTLLTASIGLIGASGSTIGDATALDYPFAAAADSGTTIQLGPTLYEVNTEDSRMAEMYEKLHDVGAFLHTRGMSQQAIAVLEELGDLALARADYHVAVDAYKDGAWVAFDCAREVENVYSGVEAPLGTSRHSVRTAQAMTDEAERLLRKAEKATEAARGSG
jgi:hypothetical protein